MHPTKISFDGVTCLISKFLHKNNGNDWHVIILGHVIVSTGPKPNRKIIVNDFYLKIIQKFLIYENRKIESETMKIKVSNI